MLTASPTTRVYLAAGNTDMRRGFDGLHALVVEVLRQDPLSGHLFLFCNKQRNRLKVLFWDGSGLWVCAKRLEQGRFSWPQPSSDSAPVVLSACELSMLLNGVEPAATKRKRWWRYEPVEKENA